MYNNKNKHNKRMIIVTVLILSVSIIALLTNVPNLPFGSVLKDTVSNVEYYLIKSPVKYVSSLFGEYTELKSVYEENAKLKESLDNYARELALNNVLSKEINELKELTEIDYLPTDYQIKYTTIISRDAQNWNNQITIDLGSMSDVKEGMAVVTSKGMIGSITAVSELSATVTLLTAENNSSQLPVMILSGDDTYYGLINGYDINIKTYNLTLLSDVDSIEEDAQVVTSGLGGEGKTPKGILVGKVNGYTGSGDSLNAKCNVTPVADYNSINYVAVIKRVNS